MSELVYYTVLTTKGIQLLAEAAANKSQLVFSHLAVGDGAGSVVKPMPSATKLINEKYRAPLNAVYLNKEDSAQVFCELILPPDVGGFYIRELGLYEQGGDLVAIGSVPPTYKSNIDEGATKALVINMIVAVENTAQVALKIEAISQVAINRSLTSAILEHEASTNHPSASENTQGMVKISSDLNNNQTDVAASTNALNKLKNQTVYYQDASLGNINLNDLTAPGFYYQTNLDYATLANNYPQERYNGTIEVKDGGNGRITQIFITDCNHVFWLRHFMPFANNTWSSWQPLLNPYNLNFFMPVGVPLPWPSYTLPEGSWLICDGSSFDVNRFFLLAKAYPHGRLPDLRGEFIRGADYGRGVDPGRAPLSWQRYQLEHHRHIHGGIPMWGDGGGGWRWGEIDVWGYDRGFKMGGVLKYDKFALTSWGGELDDAQRVGTETRPRNIAFLYIVRAC